MSPRLPAGRRRALLAGAVALSLAFVCRAGAEELPQPDGADAATPASAPLPGPVAHSPERPQGEPMEAAPKPPAAAANAPVTPAAQPERPAGPAVHDGKAEMARLGTDAERL
jgi:hypothetical protein